MTYANGRRALILLFAVGAVGAMAGAAPAGQAVQDSVGVSGLMAIPTARGPVVQAPTGEQTPTVLPVDTRTHGIVELAHGWVLAATVPTPEGQRATVVVSDEGRQRELPRLPGPSAALQERPALLAIDGQLLGLAWLAGDDVTGLAVRTADWDGRRWSAAETVSLPEHGSQMALSATVLGDGSPLLVWSRFDGEDDEVVFSTRTGGGWTPPRPIHPANDVPDILPRVVTTDTSGVLAAWSELIDGHYRLLISRFDGTRWGMPRRLPGLGAAATQLRLDGGRVLVLYESTVPRAWALGEIDAASARPLRVALPARHTEAAPAIDAAGSGTALVWPDSGRRVVPAWREITAP